LAIKRWTNWPHICARVERAGRPGTRLAGSTGLAARQVCWNWE
jgi:hypothetical protein